MTLVTERVCPHCSYIDPSGGGFEAIIGEAYSALLRDLTNPDPDIRLEAAEILLKNPPIYDVGEDQAPWIIDIRVVEVEENRKGEDKR